jgi:hypothetical protein
LSFSLGPVFSKPFYFAHRRLFDDKRAERRRRTQFSRSTVIAPLPDIDPKKQDELHHMPQRSYPVRKISIVPDIYRR